MRRRILRDPTAEQARGLESIFDVLGETELGVLVADSADIPAEITARVLRITDIHGLRHNIQWKVAHQLDERHRAHLHDMLTDTERPEVRAILDALEAARYCRHCERVEIPYRLDPGRRREYCSNKCRQAAYRARKFSSGAQPPEGRPDPEPP
ncbi:MAG: hypothetical protein HOV68_16840 [Streptomycetaceae bacterium]|nr:hypothetical protein [Streptomycetaceae bacterium]